MALTGLEIYKLLPKTNCKDCGFPTCLAFAMKLAAKQAELAACPHVSDEAKAALESAAAPPIRLISFGDAEQRIQVGNETELYRHDKSFFHKPGLLVRVRDDQPLEEVERLVSEIDSYSVDYVGQTLSLDGIAVQSVSKDPATFAKYVGAVRGKTKRPLMLMTDDAEVMKAGLAEVAGTTPLVYAANSDNWEAMAALAKEHKAPLAVTADGLEPLVEVVGHVRGAGVEDIVIDPQARAFDDSLEVLTQIRRLALQAKPDRLLGYPVITFAGEGSEGAAEESMLAAQQIVKYAGLVVMDHFDPAVAYPLLALRQNIYTDPRQPVQVTPGIYEINAPGKDHQLLITTNFSITYFSVANEVESSGIPAWLLIADSEGLSVLTGWAAGKFDADKIATTVKTSGIADKIGHRKLVIPGAVSVLSGELEDELDGWEIMVGPREAVDIPNFMKLWKA
ncbi:MAG TPA: acetyl-CoA decarbonylase/synthase complex subunit gamma [Anaerolineae bacterium]|jgi:acetyl-CoA decarbonylase/synthase complex subunit gamma|nr:acetyl-CoA decarbonylase/synthase complex subunit gamma [Anaerolineae bacterium]